MKSHYVPESQVHVALSYMKMRRTWVSLPELERLSSLFIPTFQGRKNAHRNLRRAASNGHVEMFKQDAGSVPVYRITLAGIAYVYWMGQQRALHRQVSVEEEDALLSEFAQAENT